MTCRLEFDWEFRGTVLAVSSVIYLPGDEMEKPSRVLVLGDAKSLTALTVFRVVLGLVMAAHGLQKAMDPSAFQQHLVQMHFPLPSVMTYLAIAGELFGGLGVAVGLLTRIAAFGVASTMIVAITGVHLSHGLFAANGGFEYPLILLVSALWFMAAGPGPWSLDALIRASRDPRSKTPVYARATTTAVQHHDVDEVAEAGLESFPASDSPAHHSRQHH